MEERQQEMIQTDGLATASQPAGQPVPGGRKTTAWGKQKRTKRSIKGGPDRGIRTRSRNRRRKKREKGRAN